MMILGRTATYLLQCVFVLTLALQTQTVVVDIPRPAQPCIHQRSAACNMALFLLWLLEREDISADAESVNDNRMRMSVLYQRLCASRYGGHRRKLEADLRNCESLYYDLGSGDGLSLKQFLMPDAGDYHWPDTRGEKRAEVLVEKVAESNPKAHMMPNILSIAAKKLALSAAATCVAAFEGNAAHTEALTALNNSLASQYAGFDIFPGTLAGIQDGSALFYIDNAVEKGTASSIYAQAAKRQDFVTPPYIVPSVPVKSIDFSSFFLSRLLCGKKDEPGWNARDQVAWLNYVTCSFVREE